MMDYTFYLDIFQKAAARLDHQLLHKKQLEVHTGLFLDSVCLKLYKKNWASDQQDPINARTRIFFSVWVSAQTIQAQKIYYNIHALKLRELKGYAISSRDFADHFRADFKNHAANWENVSVLHGPLTLMEGWTTLATENMESKVFHLASRFCLIDSLIDKTLQSNKI